jgi:hypothetical protein
MDHDASEDISYLQWHYRYDILLLQACVSYHIDIGLHVVFQHQCFIVCVSYLIKSSGVQSFPIPSYQIGQTDPKFWQILLYPAI